MGRPYSIHGGKSVACRALVEKHEEDRLFEALDVEGRTILKWILIKMLRWLGLNLSCLGQGKEGGCC
jgi:hypothetical protein